MVAWDCDVLSMCSGTLQSLWWETLGNPTGIDRWLAVACELEPRREEKIMRTCVLVVLSVLFTVSVAFSQQTAFNKTDNATCQRKDPFDEYIYHAPYLTGIVADGDPSDWDKYPLLEWTAVDHWCEGTGQEGWIKTEDSGWNHAPSGPEDCSIRFKAGWGIVNDWPVLYQLVEWVDDDFDFNPGAKWNATDIHLFWVGETMYDSDVPLAGWDTHTGKDNDYAMRQIALYLVEGWGIRIWLPEKDENGDNHWLDPKQPYSVGESSFESDTKAYAELQLQLFQDYVSEEPWLVDPGYSCLAYSIGGGNDFDNDGTFSYFTWGLSNRGFDAEDMRVRFSTIGFERSYEELFGLSAVESSTWGAIKNSF